MTSKDVKLPEDMSVVLACSARGSPIPTVKWRREDNEQIKVNSTYEGRNNFLFSY